MEVFWDVDDHGNPIFHISNTKICIWPGLISATREAGTKKKNIHLAVSNSQIKICEYSMGEASKKKGQTLQRE